MFHFHPVHYFRFQISCTLFHVLERLPITKTSASHNFIKEKVAVIKIIINIFGMGEEDLAHKQNHKLIKIDSKIAIMNICC